MNNPSPPEGEGGARSAKPSGRVRGRAQYTFKTLQRAQELRHNLTEAEEALWKSLRGRRLGDAKFRKQQPIGPYIGDFVCHANRLIVEADGSQHLDSRSDKWWDAFLRSRGYRVMRFWNNDILGDMDAVLTAILAELASPHPPTASRRVPPSPSRGEGV
jgi:very-short-patch-repair endonuclease